MRLHRAQVLEGKCDAHALMRFDSAAEFTEENPTIKDLISFMRNRAAKGPEFLSKAALDSLDAAQDNPLRLVIG